MCSGAANGGGGTAPSEILGIFRYKSFEFKCKVHV